MPEKHEVDLNCKGCGREMLDTPDNRTRDLCIWCTTFGDGQKVRAYDAYVKEHGAPRVAPEKPWAVTPNIVRETVAPARKQVEKKWYEKKSVPKSVAPEKHTPTTLTKPRKTYVPLEIEGDSSLVKEALEDLKKIEGKKKVKK